MPLAPPNSRPLLRKRLPAPSRTGVQRGFDLAFPSPSSIAGTADLTKRSYDLCGVQSTQPCLQWDTRYTASRPGYSATRRTTGEEPFALGPSDSEALKTVIRPNSTRRHKSTRSRPRSWPHPPSMTASGRFRRSKGGLANGGERRECDISSQLNDGSSWFESRL